MMMEGRRVPWGVERRLEFIEFRLFWEGRVNRADLIDTFGVHRAGDTPFLLWQLRTERGLLEGAADANREQRRANQADPDPRWSVRQ